VPASTTSPGPFSLKSSRHTTDLLRTSCQTSVYGLSVSGLSNRTFRPTGRTKKTFRSFIGWMSAIGVGHHRRTAVSGSIRQPCRTWGVCQGLLSEPAEAPRAEPTNCLPPAVCHVYQGPRVVLILGNDVSRPRPE